MAAGRGQGTRVAAGRGKGAHGEGSTRAAPPAASDNHRRLRTRGHAGGCAHTCTHRHPPPLPPDPLRATSTQTQPGHPGADRSAAWFAVPEPAKQNKQHKHRALCVAKATGAAGPGPRAGRHSAARRASRAAGASGAPSGGPCARRLLCQGGSRSHRLTCQVRNGLRKGDLPRTLQLAGSRKHSNPGETPTRGPRSAGSCARCGSSPRAHPRDRGTLGAQPLPGPGVSHPLSHRRGGRAAAGGLRAKAPAPRARPKPPAPSPAASAVLGMRPGARSARPRLPAGRPGCPPPQPPGRAVRAPDEGAGSAVRRPAPGS